MRRGPRTPAEEIASLLAAAEVLAKRLADPRLSATVDRRRLALLARALVRVAEANDPAFLGLSALAAAHRDGPARAALSVLVAIAVAREVTTSRRALARLALTALAAELGAPAAAADPRHAPQATAAAVIEKLGADPTSLLVAEAALEAAWLDRSAALGPLPRDAGPPRAAARILHAARALLETIAPGGGSPACPPLTALVALSKDPSIDPAVYRYLVRALGTAPAGSVVELSTGEWAVILPPEDAADPADRPRLRLLTDASGRPRSPPAEIDLASPAGAGVKIARLVDPAAASGVIAAAFLPDPRG